MIADVSDPANPIWNSTMYVDLHGMPPHGIQLGGNYAYLAQDWGNLQIADISDPSNPKLAGYFTRAYRHFRHCGQR